MTGSRSIESNLRAALRWTIDEGETDLALRLVAALWRYWQVAGQLAEGGAWAEAALAMPGAEAPTPARMWALAAAGSIAYWRSEHERSVGHYREQLRVAELLHDVAGMADAWFNLASAVYVAGRTRRFGASAQRGAPAATSSSATSGA